MQQLSEQIQKQQHNSQQMIQELMNTYMQLLSTPGSYASGQAEQQQQTLQQLTQQWMEQAQQQQQTFQQQAQQQQQAFQQMVQESMNTYLQMFNIPHSYLQEGCALLSRTRQEPRRKEVGEEILRKTSIEKAPSSLLSSTLVHGLLESTRVMSGRAECRGEGCNNEEETERTHQRAHALGRRAARVRGVDGAAGHGGERGTDGPTRSIRRLRPWHDRPVHREYTLPPLAALPRRRGEAATGGSHGYLLVHSEHIHPLLPARVGLRLAGGIARPNLGPRAVRRPAQGSVDGRPALGVSDALLGDGLARRDRRSGHLSSGTGRGDGMGPRRRPALQRGRVRLRAEASQPGARGIRVPRAVAHLCLGGGCLPLLCGAAGHRATRVRRQREPRRLA